MERYVVRDGVVESVADDLMAAQGVIANNLRKRVMMLVDSPGILMPTENTYELSIHVQPIPPRNITASVSNLTPTIWGDYRVTDPREQQHVTTVANPTLPWTGYVLLTRNTSYSELGDYDPPHPVDPGAEGSYTLATLRQEIELNQTYYNNNTHIPLYKIEVSGTGWKILEDYRFDHVLSIIADPDLAQPETPEGLVVVTLAQHAILIDEGAEQGTREINLRSPHTNNMANRYMLRISWDTSEDEINLWAYDVRITPVSPESSAPIDAMAMNYVVLADPNLSSHTLLWPAVEGVKYSVSIRSISRSSNRIASEWCDPVVLVAGLDLIDEVPVAPSMAVQRLSYDPGYLMFNVDVATPPPQPYFIQIFQQPKTAYGVGQELPKLIYEGNSMDVRMIIDLATEAQFRARVVGPGGVCSEYTEWVSIPDGIPPEDAIDSTRYTISIPVAIKTSFPDGVTTTGSVYVAEFYPPAPGCTITDMSFHGMGCYDYRVYQAGPAYSVIDAADMWFRVAPSVPSAANSSILYLAADITDPLGVFPYFWWAGNPYNGTPYDDGDTYCWPWETDDNANNTISEEQFQPDEKLYVYLCYDHAETESDAIVILNGTLDITIAPVES